MRGVYVCMSVIFVRACRKRLAITWFTDEILRGSVPFGLAFAYGTINNLSLYVLCIM